VQFGNDQGDAHKLMPLDSPPGATVWRSEFEKGQRGSSVSMSACHEEVVSHFTSTGYLDV
jgi:hypothetical protein